LSVSINLNNLNVSLSNWQSRVLLIIGPPCVGKHVLANEMCKREGNIKLLHTITTRPRRPSDLSDEIIFITENEFDKRFSSDDFFYVNRKINASYAYSKIELEKDLSGGSSIIMVFHSTGGLALKQRIPNIPTIFLVSTVDILIERCKKRSEWEKMHPNDLLKVLLKNNKMYNMFVAKENKCIQLENIIDELPIAKDVVSNAITFWRNLS
jgi:guanylate kinase